MKELLFYAYFTEWRKKKMNELYKLLISAPAGVIGFLYGGWSAMLTFLVTLIIIDYATGWIAAASNGELKSRVGLKGISRKVVILLLVAVAHIVDSILIESNIDINYSVMSVAVTFYCINELLSITENAGKMGINIPDPFTKAIEVLKNNRNYKNESEVKKDDTKLTK
jgi:toxin secretion/phage lysis holin